MNIASILRQSINSDRELMFLAKKMGLKNLRVIWLADYKDADEPTIINLGNQLNGGTHFVAAYKDHYFDSMGQVPPHVGDLDKKQWTSIQIQPLNQGHCGAYSLLFLLYATRDKLPEFYSLFRPLNIT